MDAHDWDRRYAERDLLWSEEPNAFVVSETAVLAPGRALDVGCGEGRNSIWLAERGWEVTGIDFSQVALERARALAARRGVEVAWREEDLVTADLGDACFELVVVAYLHLPWDDLRRVLGRAARAVAPGGVLLAVGHDLANLGAGHGGPPDPAVLWTVDRVSTALVPPLRLERAALVTRRVDTSDRPRVAFDTLVRATRPT